MTDWEPDIILYHANCMDGFTAAWACFDRWGDRPAYHPVQYGQPLDIEVKDAHVLIVDFSYPALELEAMHYDKGAKSIVIVDHHKTAENELADYTAPIGDMAYDRIEDILINKIEDADGPVIPIIAFFDMSRSGAGLAWDFTHPDEASGSLPRFVAYVQARDLWDRETFGDDIFLVHNYLSTLPKTWHEWTRVADLMERPVNREHILETGRAIQRHKENVMDEIINQRETILFHGYIVPLIKCPYSLMSDTGNRTLDLLPDAPFVVLYSPKGPSDSATKISLRSRDDRVDVREIAEANGGGGHRNAAGFETDKFGPDNVFQFNSWELEQVRRSAATNTLTYLTHYLKGALYPEEVVELNRFHRLKCKLHGEPVPEDYPEHFEDLSRD